jgi:heterodisulfide reductase subunit C
MIIIMEAECNMVNIDANFRRAMLDVMMGGDVLSTCFQCGKCNDVCPVSQRWGSRYNPRDLVLFSALGYKEALVAAVVKDPFVLWGCANCETCDENCPGDIPITDILLVLKNAATGLGVAPDFYFDSSQVIMDSGLSIPPQDAINKRREMLGIGLPPEAPVSDIQTIMKETGMGDIIAKKPAKEGSA